MSRLLFFNLSGLEKATVLNDTFLISILKELSKTFIFEFITIENPRIDITHDFWWYTPFSSPPLPESALAGDGGFTAAQN